LSSFPQRSRSYSADLEEAKNEANNSDLRTFDRIHNYRLEKNFVTYTEQPANGFTGTYHSDDESSSRTRDRFYKIPLRPKKVFFRTIF
jgi:hypothetical protein